MKTEKTKQTDIIQTEKTIEYRRIEGLCLPCSMTVLSTWVEFQCYLPSPVKWDNSIPRMHGSFGKTHPSTRNAFKGVYARNKLPRRLNVPSALIGNTDPVDRPGTHWVALYIDANSRGEYYDPTGRPPFLRAYVNFMNIVRVGLTTPSEFKEKAQLYADTTVYFI